MPFGAGIRKPCGVVSANGGGGGGGVACDWNASADKSPDVLFCCWMGKKQTNFKFINRLSTEEQIVMSYCRQKGEGSFCVYDLCDTYAQ